MIKDEQYQEVLKNLRLGMNVSDSCQLAGLKRMTFYSWTKNNKTKAAEIERAQLECKKRCVGLIQKAAINYWTAAAWYLERKFPNEFGQRINQTINADVKLTDDNARKKLISKLTSITAGGEEKQDIGGTD